MKATAAPTDRTPPSQGDGITCPKCRAVFPATRRSCPRCGAIAH